MPLSVVKRVRAVSRDPAYHSNLVGAGTKRLNLAKASKSGRMLRKKVAQNLRGYMWEQNDRTNKHTGQAIRKGQSKRFAKPFKG